MTPTPEQLLKIGNRYFSREELELTDMAVLQDMVDKSLQAQSSQLLSEVEAKIKTMPDLQNLEFGEETISKYDLLEQLSLLRSKWEQGTE
jgi:hypothetical protein